MLPSHIFAACSCHIADEPKTVQNQYLWHRNKTKKGQIPGFRSYLKEPQQRKCCKQFSSQRSTDPSEGAALMFLTPANRPSEYEEADGGNKRAGMKRADTSQGYNTLPPPQRLLSLILHSYCPAGVPPLPPHDPPQPPLCLPSASPLPPLCLPSASPQPPLSPTLAMLMWACWEATCWTQAIRTKTPPTTPTATCWRHRGEQNKDREFLFNICKITSRNSQNNKWYISRTTHSPPSGPSGAARTICTFQILQLN